MPLKILLVKTTSMGDVVHTLPVVSDILSAHPDAQIDWLVEAPFAAIARLHPGVRRVIPLAWRKWRKALLRRDTWRAMGELRQALKAEAYDAVIDLQGLLKSVMWARMARGPLHGYDAASIREPLASRFYAHAHAVARDQQAVLRSRLLAAAALGLPAPTAVPRFGVQAHPAEWPGRQAGARYAVLIPCASRLAKRWPEASWQQVGQRLRADGLDLVILWGSRDEQALAQSLAGPLQAEVPPFLTVAQAAGLLGHAEIVVGLDTGFTHLAAAFDVPTLGIYCDHSPGLAGVTGAGFTRSLGGKGTPPTEQDVLASLELALVSRPHSQARE